MISSIKNRLIFSLIINSFFAFTLIIFSPFEIFISNTDDFVFALRDFWWMLLLVGGGYIVFATVLFAFLPLWLNELIYSLIFAFTLGCYLQTMFFNGEMQVLIGQQVNWNTLTVITNFILWICVFGLVLSARYFLRDSWKKIVLFLSVALIAIQASALVYLLSTTDVMWEEKNGYLSCEGMLELSKENNVIVFILDYFDGRTMDSILTEDPGFLEPLEGFTYFPNATSIHSRTYPSITYLLTGEICHFDQPPVTYVNRAFADSGFVSTLCQNKIDVGLFTYEMYIGGSIKSMIRNYVSQALPLKPGETIKSLMQMAFYRDMPYLFKDYFMYEASAINSRVVDEDALGQMNDSASTSPYRNFDDEWFYERLGEETIHLNDRAGAFRFYHLGSCHLDLSNQVAYGKRSLEIVYDFLEQMRELGIYEDSTIIITTDHGYSGGGEGYMPHETAVPLTIVKPAGGNEEKLTCSDAPVSHTEFIPTVLDGFGMDYTRYGRTFFEVDENEERKRLYYHSSLPSDEIGETKLREYEIDGDARDAKSYHPTGNEWEILYSFNKVAGKQ